LIVPESEILNRELSRIASQASYMKTRFNVVKAAFPLPQRQLLAAAQATELGEQIATQKTELSKQSTRRQKQRRQAQRFAQQTGVAVPESAQESLRPDEGKFLADFLNSETNTNGENL
jgi:hypothetical protein